MERQAEDGRDAEVRATTVVSVDEAGEVRSNGSAYKRRR